MKETYDSVLEPIVLALDELYEIIDPLKESTLLSRTDNHFIMLKQWTQVHNIAMEFYIFEHIKNLILETEGSPDDKLDIETIKEVLEDTHGIELVDFATEKLGQSSDYDSSFEYFEKCENIVEKVRRNLGKKVPGKDKGYIYALTNDSMSGLVKIGLTHRDPTERLAELNNHTGIPTPFNLSFYKWVLNCALIEELLHEKLKQYRVSGNREFFRIDIETVKEVINVCIQETYNGYVQDINK